MRIIKTVSTELINALELFVDSKLHKLNFDRTHTGVIIRVNTDGYTVKYNGTEINVNTSQTSLYKVNDRVRLCIPCNNPRKAYIDSLIK